MLNRYSSSCVGSLKHAYYWMTSDFHAREYTQNRVRPTGKDIAIYYIHGTADRTGTFTQVAENLINNLPDTISKIYLVNFNDRGRGKSIESFSLQLAYKIKSGPEKNVILIGHSRGGLVAAHFAEKFARRLNINVLLVIAICSPFGGCNKALPPLTYISGSVSDMQKNSLFLRKLNDKIRHSAIAYRYFSADQDYLVAEEDTCIPEHRALYLTRIENHNHLSILFSHQLTEHIKNYLATPVHPLFLMRNRAERSSEELLHRLRSALARHVLGSPLRMQGIAVLRDAEHIISSMENMSDLKKWQMAVRLTIDVLNDPTNRTAIDLLTFHATHYAIGKICLWKRFAGALIMLAAVAIIGLGFIFTPFIGVTGLAGSSIMASGATLFYHGRRKFLAKTVADLADKAAGLQPNL